MQVKTRVYNRIKTCNSNKSRHYSNLIFSSKNCGKKINISNLIRIKFPHSNFDFSDSIEKREVENIIICVDKFLSVTKRASASKNQSQWPLTGPNWPQLALTGTNWPQLAPTGPKHSSLSLLSFTGPYWSLLFYFYINWHKYGTIANY